MQDKEKKAKSEPQNINIIIKYEPHTADTLAAGAYAHKQKKSTQGKTEQS